MSAEPPFGSSCSAAAALELPIGCHGATSNRQQATGNITVLSAQNHKYKYNELIEFSGRQKPHNKPKN
jgi:cytochrome c553